MQASKEGHCVGSTTSYADVNIWYLLNDNFDAQYKVILLLNKLNKRLTFFFQLRDK